MDVLANMSDLTYSKPAAVIRYGRLKMLLIFAVCASPVVWNISLLVLPIRDHD